MGKIQSIEAMRAGLTEAVSRSDWQKARRYIDRLKGIVLDSLLQDDPKAIRLAANALLQAGQRLELLADLPMAYDEAALAWQLRADVSTAALAARVRPVRVGVGTEEDASKDVPSLLLELLRQANTPMSNTALVDRSGKQPAVISRVLKRLEQEKKVRRWRGVKGQQLNALPAGQPAPPLEQMNRQHLTNLARKYAPHDSLRQSVVPSIEAMPKKPALLNQTDGKLTLAA